MSNALSPAHCTIRRVHSRTFKIGMAAHLRAGSNFRKLRAATWKRHRTIGLDPLAASSREVHGTSVAEVTDPDFSWLAHAGWSCSACLAELSQGDQSRVL